MIPDCDKMADRLSLSFAMFRPDSRAMRLLRLPPFFLAISVAFAATLGNSRAEAPTDKVVSLILGGFEQWKGRANGTASLEIAPSYASPLLKSDSGELLAAIGERNSGGRVVVFADRALLDFDHLDDSMKAVVLNSMRWAAGGSSPVVGLGASLEPLLEQFEKSAVANMKGQILKTSRLNADIDVFCLSVRPEGGVFGEGKMALKKFLDAGGGLVLAGTGSEEQMTFFNSLISSAGIRFSSRSGKDGDSAGEMVAIAAAIDAEDAKPVSSGRAGMATNTLQKSVARPMTSLVVERPEIDLPDSAEGPVGAALQLMETSKREDKALIDELLAGAELGGEELDVFLEALYRLNLEVGPIIPTMEDPVIPGADRLVDAIMRLETDFNDTLPAEQIRKIPAADEYPGEVPDDAQRVAKQVMIDVNYKGWLRRNNGGGARADEWRPTGLYAPPGEVIRVTVPADIADKGLTVVVGNYRGVLSEAWEEWRRYPKLRRVFDIESRETLAANGLDGTITIGIPRELKGDEPDWEEITIEGAVEAPLYVHGKTSLDEWQDEIRKLPGPWAELASDRMILTVPAEAVRKLRNPDEVMALWDEVVESTAVLAVLDRSRLRAERILFDRQLSNPGVALHAGQPVAGHVGRSVETALTPGFMHSPRVWGFLHELGHVHQDGAWQLPGSIEASCNLWSVYVSEKLLGVPRAEAHRTTAPLTRRNTMNTYFQNGAKFDTEWERETALESYLQIQEAFGWEVYQELFATYHDEDREQPSQQQDKNDQWVERLSDACGVNLAPFYQTWGLPLSESAVKKVSKLPDWEDDPVKKYRE